MKKKQIQTKKVFQKFSEVWKFSEVPKFGYFLKVVLKTMFFAFRTHLIHGPFASDTMSCTMQQLLLHWVTIRLCPCVQDKVPVSRTEGYCLYGTLLLRPRSACPVQIRANHHIDVYTDINERFKYFICVTLI